MSRLLATNAVLTTLVAITSATATFADIKLNGAGASFPAPLYRFWVSEYQKAHPNVKIDYQSIGSGGGIKGITDKTIDFGATDAPLNKKEIEGLGGADKIIQFPLIIGGVVPAYNLPGVDKDLNFSGEVLAKIFLGEIATWNDPEIVALNPEAKLPASPITPAWRSDGSGTTYVFSSYLATQYSAFESTVGTGKQIRFPLGQGGKGNEGVAAIIKQTPGSIGYIEHNFATANRISYGAVRNAAGNFIKATPANMSVAGEASADSLKGDVLAANIWNQPGAEVYPISAFSYIILYKDLGNLASIEEAKALTAFFRWALSAGQDRAGSMDYAPLSAGVRSRVEASLDRLTFKGASLK